MTLPSGRMDTAVDVTEKTDTTAATLRVGFHRAAKGTQSADTQEEMLRTVFSQIGGTGLPLWTHPGIPIYPTPGVRRADTMI